MICTPRIAPAARPAPTFGQTTMPAAWPPLEAPTIAGQPPPGAEAGRGLLSPGSWWGRLTAPATPRPAVARIMAPEHEGFSLGSGTLVAVSQEHGLVVTNWHVVRDATGQIVVSFPDGFRSGATVLATDPDWDLAALAIWRPEVQPVPFARAPQPGESLTIAGYGSGQYREATGRCVQYVAPGQNFPPEMVELAAAARQGDSGGPIFNERGELAGVLFGAAMGRTTGSYAGRVQQFLTPVLNTFQRLEPSETMIAGREPREPAQAAQAATQSEQGYELVDPIAPLGAAAAPAVTAAIAAAPPPVEEPAQAKRTAADKRHEPRQRLRRPRLSSSQRCRRLRPRGPLRKTARRTPPPTASRMDQIKTVLAAIGAFSIFLHAMRLLSPNPAPKKRARK